MSVHECPTCGKGARWADKGVNVLYKCANPACSRKGHFYCKDCGIWNIVMTKCKCPFCNEKGEVIAVMEIAEATHPDN